MQRTGMLPKARGNALGAWVRALATTLLPGRDVIGDGHVFRHGPDGKLLDEYPTQANGGQKESLSGIAQYPG